MPMQEWLRERRKSGIRRAAQQTRARAPKKEPSADREKISAAPDIARHTRRGWLQAGEDQQLFFVRQLLPSPDPFYQGGPSPRRVAASSPCEFPFGRGPSRESLASQVSPCGSSN